MNRIAVVMLCAVLGLAGCGTVAPGETRVERDLSDLLTTLPTPSGLTQSTDVVDADAAAVQQVFALGTADPTAADLYRSLGLSEAAIRRWSGPDDARLTLVASRWRNHQTATNVGGGAAEALPLTRGARAWTPRELHGTRGTRAAEGSPAAFTISLAIADVNIFIHAAGPVTDRAVIRQMDLATRSLNG